jgi:hypothetical protein
MARSLLPKANGGQASGNDKGRTMRMVRPLFVTLQSVICDIDGGGGSPVPHYVARLEALLDLVVV